VHWGHSLAIATAVVFVISSVFPIVAGLSKNTSSFPKIWGELDVGLAFVLAVMAFAVMALARNNVDKRDEESNWLRLALMAIAVRTTGMDRCVKS
jgi:hypothetical protein